MMGLSDATKWYTQQSGDPSTGFVSGGDAISSVTQIYTDMAAPGSVTDAMLAVPKVDQSQVGNLLPANVATGTDTLGTTAGFTARPTLESSTEQAWQGSRSLKVTLIDTDAIISIAGGSAYSTGNAIPILGGRTYTMSYWLYSAVGKALIGRVYWWKADGTPASTAITFAPAVTTAAQWRQGTVTAVAPTDAAFASFITIATGTAWAAGEVYYLDGVTFHAGAGGLWAPPGTPIANLGTYTDESVGRRIFTWDAVNARWQMTYGDTGWRNVIASAYTTVDDGGTNAITWTRYALRRVNQEVHVFMQWSVASALSTTSTSDFAASSFAGFDSSTFNGEAYLPVYSNVNLNQPVGRVNGSGFTGRVSGTTFVVNGTYTTTQAWPTSLPGTAVGSIPS